MGSHKSSSLLQSTRQIEGSIGINIMYAHAQHLLTPRCFENGCILNRAEDLAISIIQDRDRIAVSVLKEKGMNQKWLIHGNPGAIESQV